MDGRIFRAEDFPMPEKGTDLKRQVEMLWDYLYRIHEQLRYALDNLGADNFSATGLKALAEEVAALIEEAEA